MTILWMFGPFLMHLTVIFLDGKKDWKVGLKEAFVHFPLVIPLTNSYHAYQMYGIEYTDPMTILSLTLIEDIKMVSGKLTLVEAFLVRNKHIFYFLFRVDFLFILSQEQEQHPASSSSSPMTPLLFIFI